jgi:hypothetical protein
VPPELVVVQLKVVPATFDVGVKLAIAVPQPVVVVIEFVIEGVGLTVNVTVEVHPLLLVKVIVEFPAETAFTKPAEVMVATVVFDDTHGLLVAGVPVAFNALVTPTQADNVPVITDKAFTVKVAVAWQPLLFVYVIVVLPDATALTKPLEEIVATLVDAETQGFVAAADPLPVN